jgi:hypothetical protein
VKIEANIKITVDQLAEAFCELTDDEMAVFFEKVGQIAKTWDMGGSMQWYLTGQHMRSCSCVTGIGRDVVDAIHDSMHSRG